MGFYVTGSSFQARPMLSPPFTLSPPSLEPAPALSSPRYDPYPTIRDSQCLPMMRPSAYASPTDETSAPHTKRIVFVTTRRPATGYDRSPPVARGQPPLLSVPRRSLAPDGPTACLTPTHQTRQRISRHSPSPTLHDTLTSRGRPSVSPLP
jgi:hypothetical protein